MPRTPLVRPVDAHNAIAPILLTDIIQATNGDLSEILIMLSTLSAAALFMIEQKTDKPEFADELANILADGVKERLTELREKRASV